MALLSEYHAAIGQIIIKYGATLERFAGDGVMVIFNDPVPVESPALQAVLMALDMRAAIGTVATARAFSQQSAGPGGEGNSSFTDPDEQTTSNFLQSVRPFGSNGPQMQFGVQQQGTLIPFGGGNRYNNSAPDPYYQTLRNGN